ncbi:Hypothetical protein (Fragment), partial [Durusdinium trenchii]
MGYWVHMLKRSAPVSSEEPQAKHHAEPFRGLGREGYLQQRVHRRLHSQAAQLDDESLQVIGEMSFNEQFPAMEELTGHPAGGTSDPDALFQELGFQGYLQQRVHRKLHGIAGRFTPEELLALGKLTFSEQFRSLGLPGFDEKPQFSPGAAARAPVSAASLRRPTRQERPSLFGELGREGFLQQRVHRMLHPRTSKLSDQELLELGRKSFKEQFTALGVAGPKELAEPTLFGELGRSGFLQRRVHRRLHDAANELSDEDLLALGQQSFHEQFKSLGQDENAEPNGVPPATADWRETYIQTHVHRKLHAHVAKMSDEEVFNLGKLG